MEKFACMLIKLFEEKILLYKTLKLVLEQEKNYIVDMDVDSLWKITDRKNQLALEIEEIRGQILDLLKENKIPLTMDLETFSSAHLISSLPFPEKIKSNLKKINIKLDIIKQDLAVLASENKRYVTEYLSVINDIFKTITGSENREQYTYKGLISKDKAAKHLIREEA